MTHDDIATMIAGVGLPYAYNEFRKGEKPEGPPFICFLYTDSDDMLADDRNYQPIVGMAVELYTDAPDFELEETVEAALSGAGLVYSRSGPDYIREERMYQTTYTTSVLLTEAEPAETGEQTNNNTEVLDTNGE